MQDWDSEVPKTLELQLLAWMLVDIDWPWDILCSDKTQFSLHEQVNIHNCRIWAEENPHAIPLRYSLHW